MLQHLAGNDQRLFRSRGLRPAPNGIHPAKQHDKPKDKKAGMIHSIRKAIEQSGRGGEDRLSKDDVPDDDPEINGNPSEGQGDEHMVPASHLEGPFVGGGRVPDPFPRLFGAR